MTFQFGPNGACGRTLVKLNKKIPFEGAENVWVRLVIGAEGERIDIMLEPVTLTPCVSLTLTWRVSPGTQKSVGTPPRVVWTDPSPLAPVASITAVPLNQGYDVVEPGVVVSLSAINCMFLRAANCEFEQEEAEQEPWAIGWASDKETLLLRLMLVNVYDFGK